ncbi:hypothetical protein LOD99_14284 [Oopsacas minuta]|uniref:C2H2-type domain-containing protein n=1 Tax=Oopsacas minuta TaxID=111878 RepID=A0AAV7KIE0_9METZ|nr:hypothetical protein LOD99_14284 [Oopsacas minuta]
MAMEEPNSSTFNIELLEDPQDSIDPSLISENCSLFYERAEQGYICKVCDHQYASRRYVLFHLTNSHNIPTHSWPTCDKCGKIFTKPSKLAVHINNHPKMKLEKDSDIIDNFQVIYPCKTTDIKVIKSPPTATEHHPKSTKHRTPKPKLLTVYFIRSSLPETYKSNPHKCGKCFKSFLTLQDRDIHRELIHTEISSLTPQSKAVTRKTKRNLKRMKLNKLKNKQTHRSSKPVSNATSSKNSTFSDANDPGPSQRKKIGRPLGSMSRKYSYSHPDSLNESARLGDTDNDSNLITFIRRENSTSPIDSELMNMSSFLIPKEEIEDGKYSPPREFNILMNDPSTNIM